MFKERQLQRWVSSLLIIASVIVTPIVGLTGPFAGGGDNVINTREYFLPADYAFTIWSVIYAGLFALAIWLLLPAQADNQRAWRATPWLVVTALFNVVWMFLASTRATVPWTVLPMLLMGVSAWVAYWHLSVNRVQGSADVSRLERILHIPLQLYVGWLSVATVANTAAALNALGWGGWGIDPVTWTIAMLLVATLVAALVGWLVNQDNVYRAVFVWAYIGIVIEQADVPSVAWAAGIMTAVVLLMIALTHFTKRSAVRPALTG